jgi:hypothetical protein
MSDGSFVASRSPISLVANRQEEDPMRRILRLSIACAVGSVALVATPSVARAQENENDTVAMQANRGLKVGLGPTLLLPLHEGSAYGGGLTVDGRYGIQAGRTVIAPGGRLGGYLISRRFVGLAMPTARVTVPVGPLAPYVMGGLGAGGLTNDGESGLAAMVGGGLMIHVGSVFAFGAQATYQVITGTEMHTVAITPAISFGGG